MCVRACVYACTQGLPTDSGDGSSGGVSGQARSGTVWPERGNSNEMDTLSPFTAKKEENGLSV